MPERSTKAAAFFQWRAGGVGRREVPCPRCGAWAPIQLLESLLELLCPGCGRNVAVERALAVERAAGADQLLEHLAGLRLVRADQVPAGEGELTGRLLDAGLLRRDLRLTLILEYDAGWFAYDAAPLNEIALPTELERALEERRERGGALVELVREQVLARLGATVRGVGPQLGLPTLGVNLERDPGCRDALPKRAAALYRAVPVRRTADDALEVALWDPLDPQPVGDLEALIEGRVHAVLAEPRALESALADLGVRPEEDSSAQELASAAEPGSLDDLSWEDEALSADPLRGVLLEAIEEGAREVHLEPRRNGTQLRLRVQEALRPGRLLPSEVGAALAEQLLARTAGPLAFDAHPFDDERSSRFASSDGDEPIRSGALRYEVSGLPVHVEFRVLQTPLGPAVALELDGERTVGPQGAGLSRLGLSLEALAALEAILAAERGLVVVAAPRGGGKTAAYQALLARAVRQGGSVISLERAARQVIAGAIQIDLGPQLSGRLDELLRPRPDWLGVDGSLDGDALRCAVDVALSGGAALITVPAPDGRRALLRLEMAGLPRGLLEETVRAVLARRVVPRNCPHCRMQRQPRAGASPGLPEGLGPWVGLGCAACADQGLAGDVALAELVRPDVGGGLAPIAAAASIRERARALVEAGDVPAEAVIDLL